MATKLILLLFLAVACTAQKYLDMTDTCKGLGSQCADANKQTCICPVNQTCSATEYYNVYRCQKICASNQNCEEFSNYQWNRLCACPWKSNEQLTCQSTKNSNARKCNSPLPAAFCTSTCWKRSENFQFCECPVVGVGNNQAQLSCPVPTGNSDSKCG